MELFLRHIMALCLFVGVTSWVGAEYIGFSSAGSDVESQSSTCVVKSGAGETACSTVAATALKSLDDSNRNKSLGTDSAVAASITQSAGSSEFEREGALGGVTQADIEDANSLPFADSIDVDKGDIAEDQKPQYIGEFIDPDAEDLGSLAGNDLIVSIGEFIDPDNDLIYTNGKEQVIGAFINPDAGGEEPASDVD